MRSRLLGNVDYAAMLESLRDRPVNYESHQVGGPDWNFDEYRTHLAQECPGPPEPGGAWQTACQLVGDYEFPAPELVRAVYHRRDPLLGRNMLLEGRFYGLRFYMGVRVTTVIDETRDGRERVWGWSYQTLQGHLERGRMTYEVVKQLDTGAVEFVLSGYSQGSPTLSPVVHLGWYLFGRRTQLRFYRRCGRRLHELVQDSLRGGTPQSASRQALQVGDLVLAPSGAEPHPLDHLTVRRRDPGP